MMNYGEKGCVHLWNWIIPVTIIGISVVFAWLGTRQKAPTFDELIHVASGTAYWTLQDYRIQPENGNLPQRIAALPHYLLGTYPEIDTSSDDWKHSEKWRIADNGWYKSEADPKQIKQLSRISMLLFNAIGLWVLFKLSASLWGAQGACLSLLLGAFSPNFLGHMPLATSDFMGAWTLTLSIFCYARLCTKICPINIVFAGITVGIALLSKHSSVIIAPIAIGMLLFSVVRQNKLPVLLHCEKSYTAKYSKLIALSISSFLACLITILVIWAFHSFRFAAANPEAGSFTSLSIPFEQLNPDSPFIKGVTHLMVNLKILPEAFSYGLAYILNYDARTNFLNGEYRPNNGFVLFYLFCFLYKTPIPALILHLSGMVESIRLFVVKLKRHSVFIFGVFLLISIYGALLLKSDMNIGYRHAFPILYCSCILSGSLVSLPANRNRIAKSIAFAIAVSLIPLAWLSKDRYISYINTFGGGEHGGFRVLRESSLDWGQDLPYAVNFINAYALKNPEEPIYFAYFGSADPEAYGLTKTRYLPGFGNRDQKELVPNLEPGLYVLSASSLNHGYKEWGIEEELDFQKATRLLKEDYQNLKSNEHLNLELAAAQLGKDRLSRIVYYENFRYIRLANALKQRDPDQVINGSILVFELSKEEFKELGLNLPEPSNGE